MSRKNVEMLYRWYEAFRRHDNEACVRDSAADVEIVSYLLGVDTWQVTRFREGKMAGFTAYGNRAQALEAAGLSE